VRIRNTSNIMAQPDITLGDPKRDGEQQDEARRLQTEDLSGTRVDTARRSATSSNRSTQARPSAVTLFFFSAVGCTMGWTAVLSNLVYYSAVLGMNSYLVLNVAVFTPLLPISMAQAKWDSYFDQRYQSLRSFSFRGVVGFSVTVATVALVPLASENIVTLSILVTLMGTASAVLHGMLKQMASFIYPNCARLPAAVTSGMQASAVFVLAVSLATGFGSSGESDSIVIFYLSIAVLTALCWICFHILMSRCQDVFVSLSRRDSSLYSALSEPILDGGDDDGDSVSIAGPVVTVELDYTSLWRISWPCCVSIMVTVASSMTVASWFNRVESSDPSRQTLPQVLFYTRLLADLLGRPATLILKPSSRWCVLFLSLFRLLFVPFFFIYSSAGEQLIPRSDALIVSGVAIFAFSSGYLATASYQLAPALLTRQQESSTSKQAGLMNVCFSASLLSGLLASFTLLGVGLS